ncbi:hypothetical protein [Rossellomorea marisflavi]|uniref:hypothetical protein n=1 Tax=Rossellomorea marisflavi TaxID=189381 RepID=UPI0009A60F40|nr:hypothetical protein [Rossellomorea marisflavi]
MAYNLQTSREAFVGGKNILASEHVQFIEVGATLDATVFGAGTIELGTLIARNSSTGKFEPYNETTEGTLEPGFEDFGVLNIDVKSDGENDIIVGEVIVRGSVYVDKMPAAPTSAFKAANDNIRYIPAR